MLAGLAVVLAALAAGQSLSPELMQKRTKTISNAKMVGTALMIYQADWDDLYPIGKSQPEIQKAVHPYLKDMSKWRSENSGSRLLFNMNLVGVSALHLETPADTPAVYESKAWPDGGRIVGFADGYAKVIPAERWPEIAKKLRVKFTKKRAGR